MALYARAHCRRDQPHVGATDRVPPPEPPVPPKNLAYFQELNEGLEGSRRRRRKMADDDDEEDKEGEDEEEEELTEEEQKEEEMEAEEEFEEVHSLCVKNSRFFTSA